MRDKTDEISMPSAATEIKVSGENMPLHCPMDKSSAWASHPRVFLPIKQQAGADYECPYCGTKYVFS